MVFRKVIAAVLTAAVVLTSASYADVVYATEITETESVSADETVPVVTDASEPANEEAVVPAQEGGSNEDTPETTEKSTENETSEEEKVDTEKPEDVKESEDVKEPSDGEVKDAAQETTATDTEFTEIAGDEYEMSTESFLKSTDYFTLDGGTLKIKDDAKLEEDVVIPANCTRIPDTIFKGNRTVKTIRFDKYYIDGGGDRRYEQLLNTIDPGAFENSAIEEIIGLPAGVTAIPDSCFAGSNIKLITYETNVDTTNSTIQNYSYSIRSIGNEAFRGTTLDRTSFKFYACTAIGSSAFEDSNVTEVILPNDENLGNITIGNYAFKNCSKLSTFGQSSGDWPKKITSIGTSAFEGTALTYVNLGSIELQQDGQVAKKSLYPSTFKNCTKLTSFTFPNKSVEVADNLFSGCTSLAYVSFPEPTETPAYKGIEKIEYNAFYGCTALKSISLYNTHEIQQLAFGGCTNLKEVLFDYKPDPNVSGDRLDIEDSAFFFNTKKAKGYVMKGYDDDVLRAYAIKHDYSYETLNEKYEVKKSENDQFAKTRVEVTPAKVLPGEKVTITVTPAGGTSLTNLVLKGKKTSNQYKDYEIVSFTASKQVFSFEMPLNGEGRGPENIDVEPYTTANKDIVVSNLEYDLLNDENQPIDKNDYSGSYDNIDCGKKYRIRMQDTGSTPPELPTWLWSFSSNKPNVVAVSANGIVSSLGPGEATITCRMLNGRATKSFKIFVGNKQRIRKVVVHGENNDWTGGVIKPNGKKLELDTKTVTIDGVEKHYPRIRLAKSLAAIEDIKFKVNIDAFADPAVADSSVIKSNWKTTDTTIAVVQSASSTENSNTITIKKGAEGEASIDISYLNEGEKKVNQEEDEDNETFVIVEIWDDTPRIAEKEITVNAQKEQNLVTLFNSYADKDTAHENDPDNPDKIGLSSGKIYEDGMFRVFYDRECTKKCTDFTVTYDKLSQRMNFVTTPEYDDRTAIGKTNTYKGLWLDVTLHDRGKYIIPLPTVKIVNTPLSPRLTTTGKFNLFYNTTATDAEKGTVSFTHNLANENLTNVRFVSTQNYKDYGRRAVEKIDGGVTDRFSDNFGVAVIGNTGNKSWRVSRKQIDRADAPNYIYTDTAGKAITAGYVYLYFGGYKYPVMMSYTVPTEVTAPRYVLDYTSGTAHTEVVGQHFTIHLLNATNKIKVPLDRLDDGADGLVIDETTSRNDSVSRDQTVLRADIAGPEYGIRIGIPAAPARGAVTLRIHMTTWSDYDGKTTVPKYLRYNFTVNTTSALPTIRFNSVRPTFNLAYTNEVQKITATNSMPNFLPLVGFKNLEFNGNAAALARTPFVKNLIVKTNSNPIAFDDPDMVDTNGVLNIELPKDGEGHGTFPKGTYNYKITPVISFGGDPNNTKDLTPLTFSVVVTDNKPILRLTNATFTINYNNTIVKSGTPESYVDTSFCETKYTLTNLMTGTTMQDYKVDLSSAKYTAAKSVPEAYNKDTLIDTPYGGLALTKVTQPDEGATFRLYRNDPVPMPPATFSYVYTVSGAKIKKGNGTNDPVATLAPFNVTVRGVSTAPATTVTAAGNVNFVDALSTITYTFNVKNVPAEVTAARVQDHTGGQPVNSKRFDISRVAGASNKYSLTIKSDPWADPTDIKPNVTYKERIFFKLEATGDREYYVDVNVRPVQTFPRLTASSSRDYIYAGEDTDAHSSADLNRSLTCYVTVPAAQRLNYQVVSKRVLGGPADYPAYATKADGSYTNPANPVAIYNGVRWAANTPDSYKRAFEITDVECLADAAGKPTGTYRFRIRLKNAAAIVQNKQMTLNFLVYMHGQATNTAGVPASIKLTVRK